MGNGKPLALLAYLATRGEVRRDEVVDLLWRDVPEAKARNAFRQALHRLRGAIGEELIPLDRERLQLVRDSDRLWIDLAAFERAFATQQFAEAASHVRGDFLEGLDVGESAFEQWTQHERSRVHSMLETALGRATRSALEAGRSADAVALSSRLLSIAPYDPAAAELAATALLVAGRGSEAAALVQGFGRRLDDEMGLPLPAGLKELTARIRDQDGGSAAAAKGQRWTSTHALGEIAAFVGRESELSQMLATWRGIGEDAGATILIEGAAGIGKTRLVRAFIDRGRTLTKGLFLSGQSFSATSGVPYAGLADALRGLLHASGLSGASKHQLAEAARLFPELRDSFELPQPPDIEDDAARIRFFEGIASLVDAVAYEQPVCLVLEDVHNASSATLALLSYLASRLHGAPVLLLLTARTKGLAGGVGLQLRNMLDAAPGADPRWRRIELAGLAESDLTVIATTTLERLGADPRPAPGIARMADGNPFRAIEQCHRLAEGTPETSLLLTERDVLEARVRACTSSQRRLFLVSALLGRPASLALLADAAHLPQSAAFDAAQVLEHKGFLEQRGADFIPLSASLCDAALEIAGSAGRSFLAGWIADALARTPNRNSAELARLFALAGQGRQALHHARRAAFDALRIGAVAEAAQQLGLARTFATSPEEQLEVERLLTAIGSGRFRVGSGESTPSESSEFPHTSDSTSATRTVHESPAEDRPSDRAVRALQRQFPNWRVLLAASVLAAIITGVVRARTHTTRAFRSLADTLLVAGAGIGRHSSVYPVDGNLDALHVGPTMVRPSASPAWADTLQLPWLNATPSPGGQYVALERMTPYGTSVYVVRANRRDTILVLSDSSDNTAMGWSPDGERLLVSQRPATRDPGGDADLYAYAMSDHPARAPIDTASNRAVVEAAWSPDGAHIAWTARCDPDGQLDVFLGDADGGAARNVSSSPRDDGHLAWSPDGELIAFTSWRDDNAELYAFDLGADRLWRLTNDPAQDDRAIFSPDSRFVAFESTRSGEVGVYVMPALGGVPARVAVRGPVRAVGWMGVEPGYLDHLSIDGSQVGDTLDLLLRARDQNDRALRLTAATWSVLDPALASPLPLRADADSVTHRRLLVHGSGILRMIAAVGTWRAETAFVRVGNSRIAILDEQSVIGSLAWTKLGSPRPSAAEGGGVVLNSDREWESGLISRVSVPLVPGLLVDVAEHVRLANDSVGGGTFAVALVAPEPPGVVDSMAPAFLRIASVGWNAESRRMIYSVDREFSTQAVAQRLSGAYRILVNADSTVSFYVDGVLRWRSTLHVGRNAQTRALVWIAGRGTGTSVIVDRAAVSIEPRDERP